MKVWLSILGALMAGLLIVLVNSDWGHEQTQHLLRALFGVSQPTPSQQNAPPLRFKPDGTLETPPTPLPAPSKPLLR